MDGWNPEQYEAGQKMIEAEDKAHLRLRDASEPRYEWRQVNRLELAVGGVIAFGFLAFLVFLFLL